MITKKAIDDFFAQEHLAVAGVSGKNNKKFGNLVARRLQEKGKKVYPVNPHAYEAEGLKCYASPADLPDEVTAIHICTTKEHSEKVVKASIERGIKHIWVQQMSETQETIDTGKQDGINFIYKKCIMMFADPVKGIHSFHRGINSIFGKLPK